MLSSGQNISNTHDVNTFSLVFILFDFYNETEFFEPF